MIHSIASIKCTPISANAPPPFSLELRNAPLIGAPRLRTHVQSPKLTLPRLPSRTLPRAAMYSALKRSVWQASSISPFSAASAKRSSASFRVSASGFSHRTFAPYCSASAASAACLMFGVQILTRSRLHVLSISSADVNQCGILYFSAAARALLSCPAHIAAISTSLPSLRYAGMCPSCAIIPAPIIPTLSFSGIGVPPCVSKSLSSVTNYNLTPFSRQGHIFLTYCPILRFSAVSRFFYPDSPCFSSGALVNCAWQKL